VKRRQVRGAKWASSAMRGEKKESKQKRERERCIFLWGRASWTSAGFMPGYSLSA